MSKIEWTQRTWNPAVGCSLVSPGCTNCYAMKMAYRLQRMAEAGYDRNGPNHFGGNQVAPTGPISHYDGTTEVVNGNVVWTGKVALAPERTLLEPLRRRKPTMWFVNSMSDLFHEDVPDGWIMSVFDVMWRTPHHTYQVLTKRPKRMREFIAKWCDLSREDFGEFKNARGPDAVRKAHPSGRGQLFAAFLDTLLERSGGKVPDGAAWPTFDWMQGMMRWPDVPHNVWLGVSAERQQEADARIHDLLATPAAVRFVSAEPLLGPIYFNKWLLCGTCNKCRQFVVGYRRHGGGIEHYDCNYLAAPLTNLGWIIVGSESGPGARPCDLDWVRSIRDQCSAAGVPFFWKQHAVNGRKQPTPELDGKKWTEFPQTTA